MVIVRPEQPSDFASIREVLESAFPTPAEANLVERLRRDEDAEFALVAVDGRMVIGYSMFSRMTAPFRALALGPVATLPQRQRSGVGGLLIREGLKRAETTGWRGIFVLGDPEYYGRFGFDSTLAGRFSSPYAGPHLMALALGGAIAEGSGAVNYASAFGDLE